MEQIIKPFERFFSGSHLILGEAGSGKTRLIWSILQEKDYAEDNSINIVLTDSEKRIWSNPINNPVITINPFDTDISWVTEPKNPGIYYCACEYAPRVITFLECLATWAIQNESFQNKVRIFIDFPTKYWNLPNFLEQLNRLHYFIAGQNGENNPIEIWSVPGSLKKITLEAKDLFQNVNLVLLNPFPADWSTSVCNLPGLKNENFPELFALIDHNKTEGYYYIPKSETILYQNENPIKKLMF